MLYIILYIRYVILDLGLLGFFLRFYFLKIVYVAYF